MELQRAPAALTASGGWKENACEIAELWSVPPHPRSGADGCGGRPGGERCSHQGSSRVTEVEPGINTLTFTRGRSLSHGLVSNRVAHTEQVLFA